MNKYKNRILQDPDPVLWQQAEKEESRLQKKLNKWCSARVEHLSKRLAELKDKLGESVEKEKEYYELRDELVILCQTGFLGLGLSIKDRNWVWKGLICLSDLYDGLITRISNNFVAKYKNQIDFDNVKSYARQLFWRLITGDAPWTIEEFMNQEEPSHETKAALSEIQVHKIKREVQLNLNQTIEKLERLNLHPDDIKLAKFLFQEDMENFSEWIKQPIKIFPNWVRSIINHQIRRRQEMLSLGFVGDRKQADKFQQDISKLREVFRDESLFHTFIGRNVLFLKEEYDKYKKGCYQDEKYKNYKGVYFTTYINQYLAFMLSDLYKRKELINRPQVSIERLKDWEEQNQEPDYSFIYTNEFIQKLKSILTPRECDVFDLILKGFKNFEIAKKFSINKSRVSQLTRSIRQKASRIKFS